MIDHRHILSLSSPCICVNFKEYVLEDVNHWALAQYNVIQPGDAGFRDGLRWSMAVRTNGSWHRQAEVPLTGYELGGI